MKTSSLLLAVGLLFFSLPAFADVYPFEEEYSKTKSQFDFRTTPSDNPSFGVKQTVVSEKERTISKEPVSEEKSQTSYYKYRTITYRNFGTIMLNFVSGVGTLYKNLFTEALPEYGSDLAHIPAVSAELTGKFIEIERQVLFERGTKEKEIEDYIAAQQAPLTPEEEKLLSELRGKPITSK